MGKLVNLRERTDYVLESKERIRVVGYDCNANDAVQHLSTFAYMLFCQYYHVKNGHKVTQASDKYEIHVEQNHRENDCHWPQTHEEFKIHAQQLEYRHIEFHQMCPVPPNHKELQREYVNAVHEIKLSEDFRFGNILTDTDGVCAYPGYTAVNLCHNPRRGGNAWTSHNHAGLEL